MKHISRVFVVSALASALAACGGDGSSPSSGTTGTVSMGLTDAPAMDLDSVNIAFTDIRLKPADGEWLEFSLEETGVVDLLTLQGGQLTEPPISNEEVPAGSTRNPLIIDTTVLGNPEIEADAQYSGGAFRNRHSKLKGEFVVLTVATPLSISTSASPSSIRRAKRRPYAQTGTAAGEQPGCGDQGEVDYTTLMQTRNKTGTDRLQRELGGCSRLPGCRWTSDLNVNWTAPTRRWLCRFYDRRGSSTSGPRPS